MQEKVLITGSSGFLGSHLKEALRKEGAIVLEFSREIDQKQDVRNYPALLDAFRGVDTVFHLAGISSATDSEKDIFADFEINVRGTFNVLAAAHANKVKTVVFASTGYVYGKPKKIPVREDSPLMPTTFYGQSKLAGEEYCRFYAQKGIRVVIARLFNAFGPGQTKRVIPDLIERAVSEGDGLLELKGNPDDSRDFLHVNKVSEALILLSKKGKAGEAYNIASGKETRVLKLAQMIIEAIKEKHPSFSKKLVYESDAKNAQRIFASVGKIEELGFRPNKISIGQLAELVP